MTALRLALITRRYWPLVGGAEVMMSNLATEFRRQGCSITLLTAQWEPDWPTEIVHREIPVVRLPNPPQRAWGTLRYMGALGRWLRAHRHALDAAYVSMLKHDAYAAVGVLRDSSCPAILRAEGAGATGDCAWQESARLGTRIRRRCQLADAVVAPSPAIEHELLAAGYDRRQIQFIPNGVAIGEPRSEQRRTDARRALAEANSDLLVPLESPVAIYTGRLHEAKGLLDLVDAWRLVVEKYPSARLWLVGEGPLRDDLYERIRDYDLRHRIIMPGAFDQVDELLHAADVFVLPSYQEGMSLALLEAMAAGLPVIASDIEANRQLVEHQVHGLLVPPAIPDALASSVLRLLRDRAGGAALGLRARERVAAEFSLQRTVEQHLELFAACRHQRRR